MAINSLGKAALFSSLALGSAHLSGCIPNDYQQELRYGKLPAPQTGPVPYKKNPQGLLQQPFGYFNLGVGVRGIATAERGKVAKTPPSLKEVKADYQNNPDKYWQGVVYLSPPNLYLDPANDRSFGNYYAGLEPYLDIGQFRFGLQYPADDSSVVMTQLLRHSWDTTLAADYVFFTTSRNYGIYGINLYSNSTSLHSAGSIWLNYGLDRLNYSIQNRVYREVDVPGGKNYSELIGTENHGSGTGWNHRFFLDFTYYSFAFNLNNPKPIELAGTISVILGCEIGRVNETGGNWSSPKYGCFAGMGLGFQLNAFSFGTRCPKRDELFVPNSYE